MIRQIQRAIELHAWFAPLLALSVVAGLIALWRVLRKIPILELPRRLLLDQWRAINAEAIDPRYLGADAAPEGAAPRKRGKQAAAAAAAAPASTRPGARAAFDFRPLIVFVVVAVSLTLQEYYGDRSDFARYFPPPDHGYDPRYEMWAFTWWSGWRVFGYFIIPVLTIWAFRLTPAAPGTDNRDQNLSNYGLRREGFIAHAPIYITLFLIVLPAVIAASATRAFQHTYPFAEFARLNWSYLIQWELLYAAQFFSLEFFFRGFMLHGTKRSLGAYSIFAMVVPYCMIHYHKPIAEVLGAILAGTVLGTLALRTRSIWAGVVIHVCVAVTMDLLAMAHTGGLPTRW